MNIILFGPPGAGKGTQSHNLVNDYNLKKISTGELLRKEITNKTSLGNQIRSIMDSGSLVSDKIMNDLISKNLLKNEIYEKLIFDGYPRNLNQAIELDNMIKIKGKKISCVLSLEVDKNTVIKRISGRQTCANCGLIFNKYFSPPTDSNHKCDKKFLIKRSDDNETTLENRFDTYYKKTLPILNYYKKQNLLHKINGMGEINDIYKEIRGIIASIET